MISLTIVKTTKGIHMECHKGVPVHLHKVSLYNKQTDAFPMPLTKRLEIQTESPYQNI